jgi:DNA-binding transcriptional LysR family regulator
MDLSDLRIFSAVVEEGGITRAAERLHRVQSNVTTRIRQLEDELGVPLFIREGKRLHLAPSGEMLLGYARRMLSLADEAQAALRDATPRGLFRLGAMESTASVRLPAPLAEYSRRYPEVTLELRTGNPTQLSAAVLSGEVEAALVAEPVADAKFDSIVAFEEEPVIVAADSHPPVKRGAVPKTMIVFENGCPHRLRMEKWYASQGEMPDRVLELGSYHAMLGCVLAGMGAALLPRSVLDTFPEAKRLTVYPLGKEVDSLRTLMIWRKDAITPKVRALVDILEARQDKANGKTGKGSRRK